MTTNATTIKAARTLNHIPTRLALTVGGVALTISALAGLNYIKDGPVTPPSQPRVTVAAGEAHVPTPPTYFLVNSQAQAASVIQGMQDRDASLIESGYAGSYEPYEILVVDTAEEEASVMRLLVDGAGAAWAQRGVNLKVVDLRDR